MIKNGELTFTLGDISYWTKVEKIYIDAFPEDERQTCKTIKNRI